MCICARGENNYYKIYFALFKRSALNFAFGGKNIAGFKPSESKITGSLTQNRPIRSIVIITVFVIK